MYDTVPLVDDLLNPTNFNRLKLSAFGLHIRSDKSTVLDLQHRPTIKYYVLKHVYCMYIIFRMCIERSLCTFVLRLFRFQEKTKYMRYIKELNCKWPRGQMLFIKIKEKKRKYVVVRCVVFFFFI